MTTAGSAGVRGSPQRRLLERETDLVVLDAAAEAARSGEGSIVVIEGPAGIGKTTLLDELRRRTDPDNMDVLSARGGELERGFGFGVVRQLLEARYFATTGGDRELLLSGAAHLAEPVFTSERTLPGHDGAFAALHGLYWMVANLAERRPLLLMVDDLQWADEPSIRFLLHLANRRSGLPLLIAVTWRSSTRSVLPDLLQKLLLEADAVLRPAPLTSESVAELVGAYIGTASDAVSLACHEATGGNPFMLTELLGDLRRRGASAPHLGAGDIRAAAPERISVSVVRRVRGTGEKGVALARAAAVLGDRARLLTCGEVAGLDFSAARDAARELTDSAVLEDEEPLRFVHPLVRTAVYQDIPPAIRSGLHGRAARVLMTQSADPASIALHLAAADPSADTAVVRFLRESARRALAGGAPDTAATLLRRVLEEPPLPSDKPGILFELGVAEHEIGNDDAVRHLREAAQSSSDATIRARALIGLAWTDHVNPIRQRELIPEYERAANEVLELDRELSLQLEAAQLGALIFNADLASEFVDRAGEYVDLPVRTAAECLLRSFVARRALILGDARAAADLAEQSIAHPDFEMQGGHPLWRANVAFCLIAGERFETADRALTGAATHAARTGSPQWLSRALWLRSHVRHRRGDLRASEGDARAALDIPGLPGVQRSNMATALVDSLTDQGRLREADAILEEHGLNNQMPARLTSVIPLVARGRLRAAQGDLERAKMDLQVAVNLGHNGLGIPTAVHEGEVELASVLRSAGDLQRAEAIATSLVISSHRSGERRIEGAALRILGLVRGEQDGLDLLRKSVEVMSESSALLWRAESLIDYGAALRRNGSAAASRPILREGLELGRQCGAEPLVARATDELRVAGARPRRRGRSQIGADALTASERRVAELAVEGLSNKDIAQTLFVTLRTVEMHLTNSYVKLGIRSRQDLADALQD